MDNQRTYVASINQKYIGKGKKETEKRGEGRKHHTREKYRGSRRRRET
jgi:hypothetical protein